MMDRFRVLLQLFLLCAALPALADIELHGRVLDDTGAPIAGARVLLYRMSAPAGEGRLAETLSDDEGAWTLRAAEPEGPPAGALYSVVALAPGRAIWGRCLSAATAEPLDIALPPACALTGRAWGPDGKPIVGARVTLVHAWPPGNGALRDGLSQIPFGLREESATTTDDEGCYRLAVSPAGWRASVLCQAEGLGTLVRSGDGSVLDFPFPQSGSLSIRVVGDVDPAGFAGFGLAFQSFDSLGQGISAQATAKLGADGTFRIDALPAATYHMTVGQQVSETHHIRGRFDIVVKPGEETVVELPAERVVRLRGRVVDGRTGEPIGGARVMAYLTGPTIIYSTFGRSAVDGTFDIPCLPGHLYTSIGPATAETARLYGTYNDPIDVTADGCDMGEVALERLCVLTVRVVDDADQPVAGATVRADTELDGHDWTETSRQETDNKGEVTIRQRPGTVTLTAEKGLARTAAATRLPLEGTDPEPVTLRLRSARLTGVRLRLVDGTGAPVDGARVRVESVDQQRIATDKVAYSAGGGLVTVDGLDPASPHRVVITPPGSEGTVTPWLTWAAGELCDLGDITVRAGKGGLSGVVANADGAPVAGVAVVAYSLEQLGTAVLTDAEGRFRVEGLPSGAIALLARSGGVTLRVTVAHAGDEVRIALPAAGQPDPALPEETASQADRVALALQLTEEAVAAAGPVSPPSWRGPSELRRLLTEVAPYVPKRALALAERGGEDVVAEVSASLALSELEEAPEAALERLDSLPAELAVQALLAGALALVDGQPELARLRARTALEFADRQQEEVLRILQRARAGRILHLAGEADGEPLIRQAAAEAGGMAVTEGGGMCRLWVAAALASVDPEAALLLAAPVADAYDRDSAIGFIAAQAAPRTPDRALQILAGIDDGPQRQRAAAILLPFLPAERREQAIETARALEDEGTRVTALVRLAQRATRDQARELLESAARSIEGDGSHNVLSWQQDRGMGMLACVARRLGTGQAQDFAWRGVTVAERRVRDRLDDRPSISACATSARALALLDRDLARAMLEGGIRVNGGWEAALSDTMVGRCTSAVILEAASEIDVPWAIELWRALPMAPGIDMAAERLAGAQAIVHRLLTTAEEREAELLLSPGGGDPDPDGWIVRRPEW